MLNEGKLRLALRIARASFLYGVVMCVRRHILNKCFCLVKRYIFHGGNIFLILFVGLENCVLVGFVWDCANILRQYFICLISKLVTLRQCGLRRILFWGWMWRSLLCFALYLICHQYYVVSATSLVYGYLVVFSWSFSVVVMSYVLVYRLVLSCGYVWCDAFMGELRSHLQAVFIIYWAWALPASWWTDFRSGARPAFWDWILCRRLSRCLCFLAVVTVFWMAMLSGRRILGKKSCRHGWLLLCLFSWDGVLPSWPVWLCTPDLVFCARWFAMVLGLEAVSHVRARCPAFWFADYIRDFIGNAFGVCGCRWRGGQGGQDNGVLSFWTADSAFGYRIHMVCSIGGGHG